VVSYFYIFSTTSTLYKPTHSTGISDEYIEWYEYCTQVLMSARHMRGGGGSALLGPYDRRRIFLAGRQMPRRPVHDTEKGSLRGRVRPRLSPVLSLVP
jgi:hypothetical protein